MRRLEPDDGLAELLRQALFLSRFRVVLGAEELPHIFPSSGLYLFEEGEYIIRQDEASKDLFVIQTGQVSITKTLGSAGAHLRNLGPGEFFGEIALMTGQKRSANAIAAELCRVFRLSYQDVARLVRTNPPLGRHLQELAQRRRAE